MNLASLEELQELEDLRLETMVSKSFQQWSSSLNVSRMYVDPGPTVKARILNSQYDYERKNKVAGLIKRLYL
jgi:hypothetical protein